MSDDEEYNILTDPKYIKLASELEIDIDKMDLEIAQ